jgi:hypothetical protein
VTKIRCWNASLHFKVPNQHHDPDTGDIEDFRLFLQPLTDNFAKATVLSVQLILIQGYYTEFFMFRYRLL